MPRNSHWSRDELLLAFRLYCRQPFGRLHTRNPAVGEVAELTGRTRSAVVLKACNFASLDPIHQARGVAGMKNVARADVSLWEEFSQDSESIAAEAEDAYERFESERLPATGTSVEGSKTRDERGAFGADEAIEGPTEFLTTVRARRVQRFFRAAVLASYGQKCAISGVPIPALLNASHIIPWSEDERRRADPRNGIAFHALYDRAFDRGLLTFDENLRVVIADALRIAEPPALHRTTLLEIEGIRLRLPDRFEPDPAALAYHREFVFAG